MLVSISSNKKHLSSNPVSVVHIMKEEYYPFTDYTSFEKKGKRRGKWKNKNKNTIVCIYFVFFNADFNILCTSKRHR